MKKNISSFEKIIGVKFKNQNLLLQSLTHKSNNPFNNNEKLEFLGEIVAWVNPKEVDQQQMGLYMAGIKD